MSQKRESVWRMALDRVALSSPFECSLCHGTVRIEESWLQLLERFWCPYCGASITKILEETVTNIHGYQLRHPPEEKENPTRRFWQGVGCEGIDLKSSSTGIKLPPKELINTWKAVDGEKIPADLSEPEDQNKEAKTPEHGEKRTLG